MVIMVSRLWGWWRAGAERTLGLRPARVVQLLHSQPRATVHHHQHVSASFTDQASVTPSPCPFLTSLVSRKPLFSSTIERNPRPSAVLACTAST